MSTHIQQPALHIVRKFNAPQQLVFEAFSTAEALSQWWGSPGMPIHVISLDFKPKGMFHYKSDMGNQSLWGRFIYGDIKNYSLIEFTSSFSDESGKAVRAPFSETWPLEIFNRMEFSEENGVTTLTMSGYPVNPSDAELSTFKAAQENVTAGFNGTMNQLERYIEAQINLRKSMKPQGKARTCTYLNFPGNTEEAFNFYKSVFRTEFVGKGIQRFGDIPAGEGQPEVSAETKNLILHVELPITGGHILMATDAPESMGFKLTTGNNMNISVEPESREEATRLFNELSEGGVITMPLEDMFFGAYFGSLTDRYGINWMVNYSDNY